MAAWEILRAVARGMPFDAALDAELPPALPEADRRLAHEIAAGVLRSRDELDRVLGTRVKGAWREVPADLQDALRIGAYQLLKLERVPPHAAVQTAVELAKRVGGKRGGGFVNAVLRAVTRGTPITREHETPSGDDAHGLARHTSHPEWLVHRWLGRFGNERTAALLAHNNRPPPVVLQPVRWTAVRLRTALEARDIPVAEREDRPGIEVRGVPVPELPGYDEGAFVVQDPTQARLLAFAGVPDGALVWDACAAPGGKTAVLAQRCRALASDRSRRRLARLRDTLSRTAPAVPVFAADARTPPFPAAAFDAVLLDAPCSATGTMARHPDARWRLSATQINRLARLQAELLDGVAPTVRPGGLLVYLTCSLEPEENERQVDAFVRRHRRFRRDRDDAVLAPGDAGNDGGFGAVLRRSA